MRILPEPIRRMARESVTQPLASPVASNASAYLAEVGEHKLGWRAFRRELVYGLSGQERYRIDRLCDGCRRGLWMYFGVPQIGDALMDLAPRSLFADAGVEVDLVTDPNLTDLFRADPWFAKVLPGPSAIGNATYDFVIVPSHKHRSLKMKQRHLPRQPWFSVHARFTGPEFHRAEFAARRLADFLRLAPAPDTFAWHARQKLGGGSGGGSELPQLAPNTIALALGGVQAKRTYSHWPEVVRTLTAAGFGDGPEFHRAEFAARRLADFLQLALTPEAIARHARQKLGGASPAQGAVEVPLSSNAIALALGGVREGRTYSRWPDVVHELASTGFDTSCCWEAKTGWQPRAKSSTQGGASSGIRDFVASTGLGACRELLSRCALVIAADGGLMHLAIAAGPPVIALFQSEMQPQWRLPAADIGLAIQSGTPTVSDIAPSQIADAARKVLFGRSPRS